MESRIRTAARVAEIAPFHVMEVQTAARALEAAGRTVVHMEIGEPDFPTPAPVIAAAQKAIAAGDLYYTSALGLPALRNLGFRIPVMPTGGFFVYTDVSDLTDDSERFCRDVLEGSGVAFTPGIDFGVHRASQHVRLAYTIDDAKLADGIQRLSRYLGK